MTYNVEKQQYCKYNNGRSYGNVSLCHFVLDVVSYHLSSFLSRRMPFLSCPNPCHFDIFCGRSGYACFRQYRAPEEFDSKDLDEQIDVFTMGNNIYALVSYPENVALFVPLRL